jgi:hypothetical protein
MEGYLRGFLGFFLYRKRRPPVAGRERISVDSDRRAQAISLQSVEALFDPISNRPKGLETAPTVVFSLQCLLLATIVLLTELHYTTPNFQAMGT